VKFPEDTDDFRFELTGGDFAGQPVLKWTLEFPDRKFASATVVIDAKGEAQDLYKEFRTKLVSKYGSATTNQKLKGRRDPNVRPVSGGTVTMWKFPPNLKDKSSITIGCELAGPGGQPTTDPAQLQLAIRYTNDTLTAAAAAALEVDAKPAAVGVKKDEL
jgi:hypothetical protein